MKKSKLILIIVAVALLTGSAGGGFVWWKFRQQAAAKAEAAEGNEAAAPVKPPADKRPQKYITVEKIIVMLKRTAGGDLTPHYVALDVVLKTPSEKEKETKEQLPLLRSVAVKVISNYTLDEASLMTIDQFTAVINTAFEDSYKHEKQERPFSEAMIGKLIIE